MNKLLITLLFLLSIISFSGCEKDDICVDGDTALLVIRFYDAENPTEFKAVPSLRIGGIGNSFTVNTIPDRTSTLDSIAIPLKTTTALTEYIFIMDSADDENGVETGNADQLNFSYEINEKFISRACGFVANYENLSTDILSDSGNWIQQIEIEKTSVQIEETLTAHVKIYH